MDVIVKFFAFPKIMIVLAFLLKGVFRRGSITEFEMRIPFVQMVFNAVIYICVRSTYIMNYKSTFFIDIPKRIISGLLLSNLTINFFACKWISFFTHV